MPETQPSSVDEKPIPVDEKPITVDEKPITVDEKPTTVSVKHASSAFHKLPDEIIEQILQLTDPDSFASLVLLNSKWRRISQQAHLYAHHLSRCESYAASNNTVPVPTQDGDNLPELRRLFAREIKRNLFEAYLRPKTTTIKLISNCIGSSSAPGGEGMQFSPSPRGHQLLAYNSSRIFVLDVREPTLAVKREFKILRRPAAACILDDGSLLAVLSTDMQIDLYDLNQVPPRRMRSLILDHAPRAIALSPCGSVLAAAYEGGIEVSSISPNALPTDRRAVKCDGVDSLAFSFDGTQLLGTTTTSYTPNTVILTAPYYDPGAQMSEESSSVSSLWTTSILFPNTSRDCSHAVLLQESSSMEATWTFTYDRSFETFRAVRIDDLRNGTTYFTGPVPSTSSPGPLLPCTLPAANCQGDLVSAGFEGNDVWLYGVPEDLEAVPEAIHTAASDPNGPPSLQRMNSGVSVRSPRVQEANGARVPQWQILCDKLRNNFVSGRKITQMTGVNMVKWVSEFGDTSFEERLVVAARGVMPPKLVTEEDGIDFVDGGRITLLDFNYSPDDGDEEEITIEVGTNEAEVLEEEHRDIDTEVAIVRRRTVAQQRGNRNSMMLPTATSSRQVDALLRPSTSYTEDMDDPLVPRPMATARRGSLAAALNAVEDVSLEEAQEALDAPYAHANPRSQTTLRRAATAAAVNRQRNPRPATAGPVEYRRADGRAEHPHESDADNWVPPPPPYTKEDPGDLPAFLRHSAVPGAGTALSNADATPPVPPLPSFITPVSPMPTIPPLPRTTSGSSSGRPELPRLQTSPLQERTSRMSWNPSGPRHRAMSSSTSIIRSAAPFANYSHRPMSSQSFRRDSRSLYNYDDDDIYDVSPVGTPSRATSSHVSQGPAVSDGTPERPSPNQLSTGAQTSATEYTPASSQPHPAVGESRPSSTHPHPSNFATPSPMANVSRWDDGQSGPSPVVGRMPNARTWPRAPPISDATSLAALSGYPRTAPATHQNNNDIIAASLPPAPHPDQLARLHSRQDSAGAPRPASGSFQFPRVPVGSRNGQPRDSRRYSAIPEAQAPAPVPDQPLIISTPIGVSGAFDAPNQLDARRQPAEPVLHAPVPRHPRPISGANLLRPMVERLETISSVGEQVLPGPPSSQLTSASLRHHTSLNRRQSRARRGALKNIRDAKARGWMGKRNKKKKDETWTDVSWAEAAQRPQPKDKKCVVM
ncbi:hypothetical protein GGR53DRAFT_526210 [Hypoxylon sp. FL1150]|nr:hypothetical protein GGR53DRAFT_526210 [Hypoxylon sp. FL1150]